MPVHLQEIASLVKARNAIAAKITAIIGRPASLGHLGEFIAAEVFDIDLESSASNRGHDGRFRSGPLQGHTVNVKWYSQHQGLLDMNANAIPDHYLVMTGPKAPAGSSRGKDQPWSIDAVFLFEARTLTDSLVEGGRKIGIATSVLGVHWHGAQIYPEPVSTLLVLNNEQREALRAFHSSQLSV